MCWSFTRITNQVRRGPGFESFQRDSPRSLKFMSTRIAMKPEYDFSSGGRGKFFKQDAELRLPVYLDSDVQR